MKRLVLASICAVGFVGSAIAADLRPAVKAAPIVRPACAQFGGWYVGANVGYGYLQHNFQDRDFLAGSIDTGLPRSTQDTNSGVNGGVQAGYNYQTGCTLFGVEADWSWSDTNATSFNGDGDGPIGTPGVDTSTISSRMRWFGTVRARSGVIVDNVLIYATGGLPMRILSVRTRSSRTLRRRPQPLPGTTQGGVGLYGSLSSSQASLVPLQHPSASAVDTDFCFCRASSS